MKEGVVVGVLRMRIEMKPVFASFMTLFFCTNIITATVTSASDVTAPDVHCEMFRLVHAELAGLTGSRIDPITALDTVAVKCANKTFTVRQSVSLPARRLRSDWIERRKRAWKRSYCRLNNDFRRAVHQGWKIENQISTSDGQEIKIIAQCIDAVA